MSDYTSTRYVASASDRAAAGPDHNLAAANRVRQRCDRLERARREDAAPARRESSQTPRVKP